MDNMIADHLPTLFKRTRSQGVPDDVSPPRPL